MTKSILDYLLPYREEPAKELKRLLHEVNCWTFDQIFQCYGEKDAPAIVFYILFAYSKESPLLILMADFKKEKEGICKYLDASKELTDNLVNLTDDTIRYTVNNFLEEYAHQQWKTLQFLKIQLADLNRMVILKQASAPQEVTEEKDGEKTTKTVYVFDPKSHRDTIRLIEQLSISIDKIESQIKNSSGYLHFAQIELKEAKNRSKRRTLGVENSAHIIRHDKEQPTC